MKVNANQKTPRREFIGSLAGAATVGIAALTSPFVAQANDNTPIVEGDPEAFFNQINGKRKVVFDATQPHAVFPFAWPLVFLMTNEATGSPNSDCSVVVVLRHDAIPYAMKDELWVKYKFGDVFKAGDPVAGTAAATRNPFWNPKPGDFKFPGIGEVQIGMNQLMEKGVMFCVCNAAITVYSAGVAEASKLDAATVKKEWEAGVLPGVQIVPSGVWALGRAQEKGCAYIFAG
jgi:intracellular sulfur oxidation DsrE/DsrF family protein